MKGSEAERRVRRAAARASRRLRYRAALGRLALWLPLPLAYAVLALAALKLGLGGQRAEHALALAGACLAAVSLAFPLRALLRRPPRWAGSLELDQHHGFSDRVTTALSLLDEPAGARSDFERAAIDEGLALSPRLDPRGAVPIPLPRELAVSVTLGLLLVGVLWFEVRVTRVVPPPPSFEPLVMAADDLDLFTEMANRLAEKAEDPNSLAAIRRFNTLIEDIAARRLERREAFERLSDLEAELGKSADLDREAREMGLEDVGRELGRSGLAKSAAEALAEKRLADAEKALRELADRLKRKERPPSRAELERLRGAVERASKMSGERLAAVEERRRELAEEKQSLLKRKSDAKDQNDPKLEQKLDENRRKLERLERDKERADRAASEISDLDRQLAQAAEDLAKETQSQQQASEDIRRSADELNKIGKRAMGEREKRELLERLKELKELLRQQGQAGKERMRQMMRFGQRARGGGAGDNDPNSKGHGQGQQKGEGQGLGVELVQVPRISRVDVPGGAGENRPGSDKPGGSENGAPSQGKEWGTGHDEHLAGDPTKPQGETHEVSAAAVDTGQGSASAEVIHGAAERGFVGKAYRDIYVDYQTVAEQSLEHDQIPPGYRFYVRRYFQLIRPRE